MLIVFATAGIVLAVLLYAVVLMGCRNPRKPAWTNDFLVANLYVPAMIGLFAVSTGCLAQFIFTPGRQSFGLAEWAAAGGIAAGGWLLLKSLRVRKHLSEYAAADMPDKVVSLSHRRDEQAEKQPPKGPPLKPPFGTRAA